MQLTEFNVTIVKGLLDLTQSFLKESRYNYTYNEANTIDHLAALIGHPDSAVFYQMHEDKVAALSMVMRGNEFHDEYFGYMLKFYVAPFARGTETGRKLLAETVNWFDTHGCLYSFATPTANVGADQAFVNLLGKQHYSPSGQLLIRNIGTINE